MSWITIWLLVALDVATALACLPFLRTMRYNPRHPFETDPFTDEGDHIGRREMTGEIGEGPTTRLRPRPLHPPE